ncbi:MAG TPA: hypothetical protein VK445_00415 [Dissulfurispiraceae bacterium]|nr:hypothetical protein [Dissulfurispiraceae bacterium]
MADKARDEARDIMASYVDDVNWDDPFWLDDVEEQFPTLSRKELERIYGLELERKLRSLSSQELEELYQEQMDLDPETRNYVMIDVLEGMLEGPGTDRDAE